LEMVHNNIVADDEPPEVRIDSLRQPAS
jgi:hypothetical protein